MLACIAAVCFLQMHEESESVLMYTHRNPDGRILDVLPSRGPFRGHSAVTIRGQNLFSGGINDIERVTLNGVPVDKIISLDADQLVVRSASLEGTDKLPGEGNVEVLSRSKGHTVGHRLYEYMTAPIVFSVEPDSGAHVGGTAITIRGKHLCDEERDDSPAALRVSLCDQEAKFAQCRGSSVVALTSAMDALRSEGSACDLQLHSKTYGAVLSEQAFTYRQAPVITHIAPSEGAYEGGNNIRIFGSELTGGKGRLSETVSVKMGGKPATVLDYTPSMVLVRVPRDVGAFSQGFTRVEVKSARHGTATRDNAYRVHKMSILRAVSPRAGRASGGEHLTLIGHGLGRGDVETVSIGEHKATVLYVDPAGRKIKVLTPRFDEEDEGELLDVSVHSRLYGKASKVKGFRVHPRGSITGVRPVAGPSQGGTLVTIFGRNLGSDLEDFKKVEIDGREVSLVSASPTRVVVKTREAPPGSSGAIRVHSQDHGVTHSPAHLDFSFSKNPQITSVRPSLISKEGGHLVMLQGERLCNAACDDLRHIEVGNAFVTEFESQSPDRIVFRAPSAEDAGGDGAKTVVVRSAEYGDAEAPDAMYYLEDSVAGTVWPADVPLQGGSTVTIKAPDLGKGDQYRVLLAGVEAKVLSASPHRIEVQAGDAKGYAQSENLRAASGIKGNVIVEAINGEQASGLDTQLLFRYNPECSIESVESKMGPVDGERTIIIRGLYLGMADERVYLDGEPVDNGLTVRKRQGGNMMELRVRSKGSQAPSQVVIKSARVGRCAWNAAKTA
jgi:hypothetical protein